ncbi:uncharacterized protein LOC126904914 [Daktulosphaira vitifoliae]|uniref:uncharacterized protein LOC126904914 n=1 Tax=Daktulosphaira vitifoliae TaxID=58002 RepID=UPI0021AA1BE5|nr:uncharacterized protein LOC126904914 [Daktulosphaira vitifoliae]
MVKLIPSQLRIEAKINKNIIIFSCDTNLKFLCNSKSIYLDGTFQYYPKHFVQLFTIHGYINNYYVPLVFCLLKNKFIETYKEAFESRYRKLLELGLSNAYKTYVSDCFVDDFMTSIPEGTAFIEYADYLIDNYISEESKYPPKIWTLMDPLLARITNNRESFHSYFNEQFYKAHPSINIFLKLLIENVQSYNYIKIYSSNNAILR